MTTRPAVPGWRAALSMFTIVPVAGPQDVGPGAAGRVVLWLPAVGAALGAAGAAVMLAVEVGGDTAPRRLLAATVAVAVLALLSGGLHLDGLADTIDGLGSRLPRQEALDIMRRSDTGPMGVAALLLVVLLQVTALAAISPGWLGAAALLTAVITSRVAVLLAAHAPAARPQGFGALLAGTATRRAQVTAVVVLAGAITAAGMAAGGPLLAARGLAGVAAALGVAAGLRRVAVRRLGGLTGDVFGAMIELSAAVFLLVIAAL